jgi:quercetin dioxygenase-like cupin family protein
MTFHTFKLLVAPLLSSAFLLSLPASAADTPPEKAVGLTGTADAVGSVELAPHNLPGSVGDYDLRARTIGIAPSGAIQNHPHAGRPGIVRVTKGTVIEYRGTTARTLKVGDSWYENADTVHWFRNPSTTEAAEIWVVDLVPKKK